MPACSGKARATLAATCLVALVGRARRSAGNSSCWSARPGRPRRPPRGSGRCRRRWAGGRSWPTTPLAQASARARPQCVDEGGHHRQVIGVVGRAHADLALEPRRGDRRIGRDLLGPDLGLVVGDHPGAAREGPPAAFGIAQVGGDARVELGRP